MEEYPNTISKQFTEILLKQMNNSIYKVKVKEGKFDIGFFCNIKYKNKKFSVLISNYDIINLSKNNNIEVKINNEITTVELGELKYFNKKYDLSILEIKENKNNKICFLELDDYIYEKDSEKYFDNSSIYLIHYNNSGNIYTTFGKINIINSSKIISRCLNSKLNFKDFPIFNLSNNKIIGISKKNNKSFNNGIFFKFIINEFIHFYENIELKKNYNNWNEIDIYIKVNINEINKEIYFLNHYDKIEKNYQNNFKELNSEVFINDNKQEFNNYFIPDKEGIYKIKLKFQEYLKDSIFMFAECKNIIYINFIRFNIEYITNMKGMFLNCTNLEKINLYSLETKNVEDMSYMFYNCKNLKNLDISFFNTNKVSNKILMFSEFLSFDESKISNVYDYQYSYKIIILGNSESGKSELIKESLYELKTKNYRVNISSELTNFYFKYDMTKINLKIDYNTSGQEIYYSIPPSFYRYTDYVIIIYSIDNINTLTLIDYFVKECKIYLPDKKIFLLGNKNNISEEK